MNISNKQQLEIDIELAKVVAPMNKLKEMLRKDVIAKKKFEMLESVAMDVLLYCSPKAKKRIEQYNEVMKGES